MRDHLQRPVELIQCMLCMSVWVWSLLRLGDVWGSVFEDLQALATQRCTLLEEFTHRIDTFWKRWIEQKASDLEASSFKQALFCGLPCNYLLCLLALESLLRCWFKPTRAPDRDHIAIQSFLCRFRVYTLWICPKGNLPCFHLSLYDSWPNHSVSQHWTVPFSKCSRPVLWTFSSFESCIQLSRW